MPSVPTRRAIAPAISSFWRVRPVSGGSDRSQVHPVIDEYFGPQKPRSTGVMVKGLALDEYFVEIDAYGVMDD